VQLHAHLRAELLHQAQGDPRVDEEAQFQDQIVLGHRSDGPEPLRRLGDEGVERPMLRHLVDQGVVGGDSSDLLAPKRRDRFPVSRVEPDLASDFPHGGEFRIALWARRAGAGISLQRHLGGGLYDAVVGMDIRGGLQYGWGGHGQAS